MADRGSTSGSKRGQNGGGRGPVDSKTKAKVRRLARSGMSRNAIAREVGIGTSTVSRICATAQPPITFAREHVKAATEAKVLDAKARRAQLADDLLGDVTKLRGMLFEQVSRVHFSVTNGREEYEGPLSPGEMKDLATTFGILLDKHAMLVKFDTDDRDLPAVDAWLAAMMGGDQ